ncbi:unnamed protein product [Prunus armeniaca]
MNSHRLLGPKMKYLPLAAKQYTYEICNKSIYSSSVWSYASSQGSPNSAATLTPSVRYASATIYLLRGHNSNL